FCFFFQAEDGIRDRNVTGVQTCALPIYPGASIVARVGYSEDCESRSTSSCGKSKMFTMIMFPNNVCQNCDCLSLRLASVQISLRSEERRVGKESSSRGGAWHGRIKGRYT